jgi:hypothetical protein
MTRLTRIVGVAATVALLLAAACSPEGNRKRGDRGADIGNRPDNPVDVELHGKSDPAHKVPAVGEGIKKR